MFEARYLDLASTCLREKRPSAWSLPRKGQEVGGGRDEPAVVLEDVGVMAADPRARRRAAGILRCAAAACGASASTHAPARRRPVDRPVEIPARRRADRPPKPCCRRCAAWPTRSPAQGQGRRALRGALPLRRRRLGGQPLVRDPADSAGRQAAPDGAAATRAARPGRRVPARPGRGEEAASAQRRGQAGAGRSASSAPNQRPVGQAATMRSICCCGICAGVQRRGCNVQSRCVSMREAGSASPSPGQPREPRPAPRCCRTRQAPQARPRRRSRAAAPASGDPASAATATVLACLARLSLRVFTGYCSGRPSRRATQPRAPGRSGSAASAPCRASHPGPSGPA